MKLTLLIPILNEIDGLRAIMPKVRPEWYDQLIVVDGGSTDGSVEYCRQQGYFLFVQKDKGVRAAYMEALPHVTGDVLLTFSPDGNSLPETIPALRRKMEEGYDMVICSRYLGSAKSEDDDWLTGFGNWLFTKTINLVSGGHYTDAMVILRAYKVSLVHELGLDVPLDDYLYGPLERIMKCRGLSYEPLLSTRAAQRGLRITEIPGDEPPRIGGERKLRVWRWGSTIMVKVLREWLSRKYRMQMPPGRGKRRT